LLILAASGYVFLHLIVDEDVDASNVESRTPEIIMDVRGLTPEEIEAEVALALPDKEVVSILDLNVDVDVFLDVASPIDLAVAAQLNVAAPIDAAAAANVLTDTSEAGAMVDQTAQVNQNLWADATATALQDSAIDQSDVADGDPDPEPPDDGGTVEVGNLATLEGPLLNVDVNVDVDTDLTAPIAGAVAANANVAAPISAAVSANVLSDSSDADAISTQTAVVNQDLRGITTASSDQVSDVMQGTSQLGTGDTPSGEATGTAGATSAGASSSGDSGGTSSSGDSGGTSSGSAG
jgi:hypothetical protein